MEIISSASQLQKPLRARTEEYAPFQQTDKLTFNSEQSLP
jgi:hypothetical protein